MLSRKPSKFNQLHQQPSPNPAGYPLGSDTVVVLPRNYNDLHQKLTTTGSQYRNSRTGNRSTRTQIDHDVFEGLPVRHWRKRPISVNAAPEKENIDNADLRNLAWKELPMPRDSHLLSPMSQDLLRAARMPQAKKPMTPLLEDDKDPEDDDADGDVDTGFVAKRWAILPKELEGPEPEFLAKRRKGLPSVHSGALGSTTSTGPMRKTKIRKIDTEGNNSVWEVLVPEGQTVEGEVIEEETSPTQAPAPGTVVEGVGVVNAEGVVIARDQGVQAINRRRPPPPKRRAKGPGRGRKKKVAFVADDGAPTTNEPDSKLHGPKNVEDAVGLRAGHAVQGEGTVMGDDSLMKDGDQEGDEGSEEGSEDEEGEEGEREEGELTPSPSASRSPAMQELPVIGTEIQVTPSLPDDTQAPATIPLTAVVESSSHVGEPLSGLLSDFGHDALHDALHDNIDEAPDEMLDEPMEEMLDEPTDDMLDEPINTSMPKTTSVSTAADLRHTIFDVPAKIELESSLDVPLVAREVDVAEAPGSTEGPIPETTDCPVIGTDHGPAPEIEEVPPPSTKTELTPTRTMESTPPFSGDPVAETEMETVMDLHVGTTLEVPQNSIVEAIDIFALVPEPSAEAKCEPSTGSATDSIKELGEELSMEAMTTPLLEAASEPVVQFQERAMMRASAEPAETSITEPVAEPLAGLNPDTVPQDEAPTPEHVNRSLPEATPERRFSYTRPTSSPKAPTPSPPTPVENAFSGLQAPQAPYLSPKAPTMSPPTPIDRGASSSPDIPLSSQFHLPPHIDAVQEADQIAVFEMQEAPNALHISVQGAPQVEPPSRTQIAVEHGTFNGMAEPKVGEGSANKSASAGKPVRFDDGEEDLLGSLERSLGS